MTDETLFAAALEKPDPAARAAYLDSACPDPATRTRLDALLAAHDRAGDFLARPAVALPDPERAATKTFSPDREADHTRTHGGIADTDTDEAIGFLAPPRRSDSLGRIGHYEVLEVLGRGGFGIVFRAFDEVLQRVVAVKVLAPSMAATSPARKRFLREARSSAAVRHENVVQVFSVEEAPLPYLVMEFIPGETLQHRLDRVGPLDVPEVLRIGRQIAAGLAAAHETGLIHRDIKPSNILIDSGPQQRVKITDFGLARAADDASISQSGVVAGTPMYMAPEQAKGDALDHRADLFSLGSVLYVMCSGRPPFRASGTLAVLKRVCEEDPRPIREVIPEVPEWLCRVIEKLHAKDPTERYQSAKEVADVLADCEAQLKTQGELREYSRIPGGQPAPNPPRLMLGWPTIATTAALLCATVFVLYQSTVGKLSVGLVPPAGALAGVLIAILVVGVSQHLGWLDSGGGAARPHGLEPSWKWVASQRRRLWQFTAALWLFALLFWGAILFGEAAYLYATNQGAVEFMSDTDVLGYDLQPGVGIVGKAPLLEPVKGGPNATLRLGPGAWQMEAKCKPGRIVERWEVTTKGLFTGRAREYGGERLILEVNRGDHLIVRPVLRDDPSPARPADGFVSLFNGKDLTGWKKSVELPGIWHVEDGILTGRYGRDGYLFSERGDYEDFHLRAEVKIGDNSNGGLLFRCESGLSLDLGKTGGRYPQGYELDIVHSPAQEARTGSLWRAGKPYQLLKSSTVRPDTWFKLDVIVQGNHIVIKIDGQEVGSYLDAQSSPLPKGHIGLQVAWPETSKIQFRKIEIKELPPSLPAESWVQLFNGKDLTGWKARPDQPGTWKVADGVLVGRGPAISHLMTVRNNYEDFHLRAQVRFNNPADSGIVSRCGAGSGYTDQGVPCGYEVNINPGTTGDLFDTSSTTFNRLAVAGPDRIEPNTWGTLEVIARGNRIIVLMNGKPALNYVDEKFRYRKGHLALQVGGSNAPGTVAEFRKIEIKELPPGSPPPEQGTGTVDLLALIDPSRDTLQGTWMRDAKGLFSPPPLAQLQVPFVPPDNYRLTMEVERTAGSGSLNFGLIVGGRTACITLDYKGGVRSGIGGLDGKLLRVNESVFDNPVLGPGRNRVVAEVRGHHVIVQSGTTTVIDWDDDPARFTVVPIWNKTDGKRLYLGHMGATYRFHHLELTPLPTPAVAPFDASKAKEYQDSWAKYLGVPVEETNSIGMKLRLIPPGEFLMGSTPDDIAEGLAELTKHGKTGWFFEFVEARSGPQKAIRLTRPYYLGTCEVTIADFRQFVAATGYRTLAEKNAGKPYWEKPGWKGATDPRHPVTFIAWPDAKAFCDWLSRREGRTYQLPTEAEWEFACRAGTTTRWSWGNDRNQFLRHAWFSQPIGGGPARVGEKVPNAFGLFDMHGNAEEWCADWHHSMLTLTPEDPQRTEQKDATGRVVRGGYGFDIPEMGRSGRRSFAAPTATTGYALGFRVAVVGDLKAKAPPPAVAPFDAAKAKELQDAWAKHLGVPVEETNSIGMKLRLIPPGEFTMGSSKEEIDWLLTQAPDLKDAEKFVKDWVRSEGPDRRVTIGEPFLLGAHEVTVGQFREFVKATGYKTDAETAGGGFVWNVEAKKWERKPDQVWSNPKESGGENHPVKFVTSDDIRAFCAWLGKQDGRTYAIPTEEQWEYACRAGTATRWSFGDDPAPMRKHGWTAPHASAKHHPVGRLTANPFGLFDMYGNPGELVLTARGEEYQRGGTAGESPLRARSASRVPVHGELDPIWTRGFRVAVIGDLKAKPTARADPAVLQPLRDLVAATAKNCDTLKARFEAGTANGIELLSAEANLTEARIRLARAEGDQPAVIGLHEVLVAQRRAERDLIAARVDAGVTSANELSQADARLADARARLAMEKPPPPPALAPAPRPKP